MRRAWPLVLVVTGCRPPGARPLAVDDLDPTPVVRAAAYDLRWNGALIGEAVQRDDGARLVRRERIVVRRGDQVVTDEVVVTVDRDGDRPTRVVLERGEQDRKSTRLNSSH